tara:strand:- start:48 stop:260 length:213 start_codon:yes stop_codon:yes gene_type:complete
MEKQVIECVVDSYKRLNNSSMGNPTYEFTTTTGCKYKTKPNISDAYKVHHGMIGKPVRFTVRKNKIEGID